MVKNIVHLCFFGDEHTQTFTQSLYKNFKPDSVNLAELVLSDVIGANVCHLLYSNDTEEKIWWDAEVVELDVTSEDKSNSIYFVWCDNCSKMDKENLEGH